jgi:hypothetical protein
MFIIIVKKNQGNITLNLPDVALTDEDTSVMVRLGQSELENLGLETAFQEIFDLKTQNVIELHARFVQDSNTDETTEQGITWK